MQSPSKVGGGAEGPPRKGRVPNRPRDALVVLNEGRGLKLHRLSDEMAARLRAASLEIRTEFAKRERFRPLLGKGVRRYEDFPKFR